MTAARFGWIVPGLLAASLLHGCGGGASSDASSVSNAQFITVDAGPTGGFTNMMTTLVTICVPGTSTCQTIPGVQVDTGSSGLRLLASTVTIPLPSLTSAVSGAAYSECAAFADGVVWGTLAIADVKLAGETAKSISLQLIQDAASGPAIPASCSAQGAPQDTQALLGSNGILGIGVFLQDCGAYCVGNADAIYYVCTSRSGCSPASITLALQVSNPAAFFARDNNGVVLQLPGVSANGVASTAGLMTFGIGTQSNNALAAPVIGVPDAGAMAGAFSVSYRGSTLTNSFFDSGSSALFFDDTGIPVCPSDSTAGDLSALYCPGTATSLSTLPINVAATGSNGVSVNFAVSVANAQFLLTQAGAASLNAFDDLAGPAGTMLPDSFDFGVPFFFGRTVYTAFEQRATPNGVGPYFAATSAP